MWGGSRYAGRPARAAEPHCFCGGGEWLTVFRTERFGLVRCSRCGCFRVDPPPLARDDDAGDFYTGYYEDRSPPAEAAATAVATSAVTSRYWRVVERVPALRQAHGRALDVGCGEGTLCGELQAAGFASVGGIDVSASRVARARKRFPGIDFYIGQIETLAPREGTIDLLTFDNVIEHLPDPLGFVSRLRQLLSPGGQLVIITPNMRSGHFRLLGRRWTNELAPHAHVFLFTPDALRRLAEMAGLMVVTAGSFHVPFSRLRDTLKRGLRGDLRGAAFRAMIDAGGVAGRVLGEGEMQYVVARRADPA